MNSRLESQIPARAGRPANRARRPLLSALKLTLTSTLTSALALLCLQFVALPASAQTFPERPVRVIAPYGGGSASDTLARLLLEQLHQSMGGTWVLENKPGGTGIIAAQEVAKAPPDGHVLLLALSGTHSINPVLYKQLPYDPVRSFTPIARLTLGQSIFAVPASLPVNSINELIVYARANPGKLSFAAHNAFATFGMERFRILTGTDMVKVPYRNYADTVSDLVAGRIDIAIMDILNTTPLINAGKLKGLALTGAQKSALNPNMPAVKDVGVPDFVAYSWIGLVGPAGMQPALVNRLNVAVNDALKAPKVVDQLKRIEYYAIPQSADEFGQFIREQLAVYASIAKQAKIEAE